MTAHGVHPPIGKNGLADGCPRCAEHAVDPFYGLDDANFGMLLTRTLGWMRDDQDSFPRSDTEHVAMSFMEGAVVQARRLKRAGFDA